MVTPKTIAVIGAGTMGQGIAQTCVLSGYTVLIYDIQPQLLSASVSKTEKNLQFLVDKGKITSAEKDRAAQLIKPINDFQQVKADLVVEAVAEDLTIKQKVFGDLEKISDEKSILCTNTSSIPITLIASSLKHPSRFAGLHFFNPATLMKLVEIVQGAATSPETIQVLAKFARSLNKVGVLAQDSPGFIVNRVARHFYTEALKMLEENVTDIRTLDALMRSTGFKMGPFELMDLIGVDVNHSVTTSIFNSFYQESRFRPSRLQQQKVNAGHHGRKTGKGFYDHTKD